MPAVAHHLGLKRESASSSYHRARLLITRRDAAADAKREKHTGSRQATVHSSSARCCSLGDLRKRQPKDTAAEHSLRSLSPGQDWSRHGIIPAHLWLRGLNRASSDKTSCSWSGGGRRAERYHGELSSINYCNSMSGVKSISGVIDTPDPPLLLDTISDGCSMTT